MFKAVRFVVVGCFFALGLMACHQSPPSSQESASSGKGPRVVNFAVMPNYIPQEVLNEFEKRTGIKVQVSNFSSGEELLSKLQAGLAIYDLTLTADYLVYVFSKLNLIQPLEHTRVHALNQLSKEFMNPSYDPQNRYSVPYDRGTTGIAVNRKLYPGKIQSWKQVLQDPTLTGKVSLLDDIREVLGCTLKSLGYSLNSKNPEELRQAKETLLKSRKQIKAFTSEPIMPLVNGEFVVSQAFMMDALQARKLSHGDIEYVFPEEGGTVWYDNFVILKGAPHQQEAYELINFLLEPKVNAKIVLNFFVAPANPGTLALLPPEILKDPAIFPSPEVLKKYEIIEDLGDTLLLWDRIWTEIKVSKN